MSLRRTAFSVALLAVAAILVATAMYALVARESRSVQVTATPEIELRVSMAADRSADVPLDGARLSGDVHIFASVADDAVRRVDFWIDDPEMAGDRVWRDWAEPYDLAGSRGPATARPYASTALSDGVHTVTALASFHYGTSRPALVSVASFRVDNGGGASLLPGHVPGQVYLGFSAPQAAFESEIVRVGQPTVRRGPFVRLEQVEFELREMQASISACRLPWTSWKGDWRGIASGEYDDVLRERFAGYRDLSGPALATFAHEPVGDGAAADYAAAWRHILDLAEEEGTGEVSLVPIMNGHVWRERGGWTDEEIAQYLTPDLLPRWPMVGVDVYQGNPKAPNQDRLARILEWSDRVGVRLIGLGETGVRSAADWVSQWSFIEDNADRFMAVSYFNSPRNLRPGASWQLEGEKLDAFQQALESAAVATYPACS